MKFNRRTTNDPPDPGHSLIPSFIRTEEKKNQDENQIDSCALNSETSKGSVVEK